MMTFLKDIFSRHTVLHKCVTINKSGLKSPAYNETYFVLWALRPFSSSDLKQSNEYFIKQPSDF